jgi:hypothetical protein
MDMINGRVVKGVNFVNIKDAGDPVECCKAYCASGADEIAMLDINATVEGRATTLETVRKVAIESHHVPEAAFIIHIRFPIIEVFFNTVKDHRFRKLPDTLF